MSLNRLDEPMLHKHGQHGRGPSCPSPVPVRKFQELIKDKFPALLSNSVGKKGWEFTFLLRATRSPGLQRRL